MSADPEFGRFPAVSASTRPIKTRWRSNLSEPIFRRVPTPTKKDSNDFVGQICRNRWSRNEPRPAREDVNSARPRPIHLPIFHRNHSPARAFSPPTKFEQQLHPGIDEARSLLTFPLTILAWLETTALKLEMAPYIKRSRESDTWDVFRGEQAFGPVPFSKILRMLLRGEGPIPVLHQSEGEMESASWRTISCRAWPLNAVAGMAWIVGFWLLAVALGFVAVTLLCPVSIRTIAGSELAPVLWTP